MLRSLSSGVSGLQSHQTQMDVIGNNIANVNTNGFKSSRTTFRDVYYQTLNGATNASGNLGGSNPSQIGYGSQVGSVDVLNTRAGFVSTGRATDCYINGEGYFVVKDGAGNEKLTQVGTFGFDGNGNLVDGNNYFVCGYPVSYSTNTVSVGGASVDFGKANAADLSGYTVKVVYADPDGASDKVTGVVADTGTKTITVTYTPNVAADILTKDKLQTGLQGAWTWEKNGSTTDTDGTTAITAPTGFATTGITVADAATDTTTKIAATTGMIANTAVFDKSSPEKIINSYGELKNISIGTDGTITGEDANGTIQTIGQLALANVPNPDALTMDGNSYYKAANNTGTITYNNPGSDNTGTLKTGGLEGSNVDLANEFSNMIVTQRGFQANSKIITVSDEMLETLVNMKR